MEKFVPYEKLSKKKKREQDLKRRQTWGISPVTRKVQSKKAYSRKKTRKEDLCDCTDAFFCLPVYQKHLTMPRRHGVS